MSLPVNQPSDEPAASTRSAASQLRGRARLCRAGLVVVALLGTGVLAAACGGRSSGLGVASLGTTTTTTAPSAAKGGGTVSPSNSALAYVNCMRTHGEPNMPDPTISEGGRNISVSLGSGVDPNSPQFTAANNACEHLISNKGGTLEGSTITPADQADYLKAAACMRSHGVPDFPDPVFEDNSVAFNTTTPIDTSSSQYNSALATCEKLIPAGLPYSSPGAP